MRSDKIRLRIYKTTLKEIREIKDYNYLITRGLCAMIHYFGLPTLGESFNYHRYDNPYYHMKTAYPEIYKHKPKRNRIEGWWFYRNEEGFLNRLCILLEAINALENGRGRTKNERKSSNRSRKRNVGKTRNA